MDQPSTEISDITCSGVTAAVHILGDKWTAHIIRVLSAGPLRFGQIQDSAGGINPRTLSERLARLEHCGIVVKNLLADSPSHTAYVLTEKGCDLLPILQAMAAWGRAHENDQ